nr:BOI-related E3 ubiquitin-protein ligase 1 [Ipomoea batatas]
MRKRKQAWEMQKKAMEAMIANYYIIQALIMAERVKALEKTRAALHVALHLQPTPPASGTMGRLVVKLCWRESATMMAWPCRHLCMCKNCAGATTKCCPICHATFQDCIAVNFY